MTTVVPPTVDSDGYTLHQCTRCSHSYKDNYVPKILLGDVDGDGIITIRDCVLIARYYSNWNVDIITEAADVDGDGIITLRDAIEAARIYSGWYNR